MQAKEPGALVIRVERAAAIGGKGQLIGGVFGIESSMQKDVGIEVGCDTSILKELKDSQLRGSGTVLSDMVKAPGKNIDWLLEHISAKIVIIAR